MTIRWVIIGPLDRDFRHILTLSGLAQLPKRFQVASSSPTYSKPPFSAFLGGVDLNGDGTYGDLLPGTKVNQFNRGLGKNDLRRLVKRVQPDLRGETGRTGQALFRRSHCLPHLNLAIHS